jgi:hypothetical protein
MSAGEISNQPFTKAHVSDWVRQFKPQFAEYALRAAEAMQLVGRADTNSAINNFFENSPDVFPGGASIVPLGGPKDGASIVAYYARTAAGHHNCEVRSIETALALKAPLLLVDDFIGRGSTTISFFEGLLGLADTQQLGQDRPEALDEVMASRLRSRDIALVFSAGLDGAEEAVRAKLESFGVSKVRFHVDRPQSALPTLSSSLTGEGLDVFTAECRRIGQQLVAEEGVAQATIDSRSLGYGNHGLLVVFPYNTPTATLTALWKAGVVDDQLWQPLIPRLKKT